MSQENKTPELSKKNTRKHWALYVLDAWETENGREEGATADDVWNFVGGEESIIFTSRRDAAAGLRAAHDEGFSERRSIEGTWDLPILIAYRLNKRGAKALKEAGKPTEKPNRHKEGYTRELPVEPAHEVQGEVLGEGEEEKAESDWLRTESPEDWIQTEHGNLYKRKESDGPSLLQRKGGNPLEAAKEVAKAFHDGWDVIVTVGPYRAHDVSYRVDPETKRINLDYYSIRPGTEYTEDIIRSITKDLKELKT